MIISLKYGGAPFTNFVFLVDDDGVPTAHLNFKEINLQTHVLNSYFLAWFSAHPPHNYKIPKAYDLAWDCLKFVHQ